MSLACFVFIFSVTASLCFDLRSHLTELACKLAGHTGGPGWPYPQLNIWPIHLVGTWDAKWMNVSVSLGDGRTMNPVPKTCDLIGMWDMNTHNLSVMKGSAYPESLQHSLASPVLSVSCPEWSPPPITVQTLFSMTVFCSSFCAQESGLSEPSLSGDRAGAGEELSRFGHLLGQSLLAFTLSNGP